MAEEDTDPRPFDLLVYLIELQSVSHLSHKLLTVLCRKNGTHLNYI